jgi:hypothetical protein
MSKALLLAALAAAAALVVASVSQGATKTLYGTVGPGETIMLKTSSGKVVRSIPTGTYTIVVNDRSDEHNFRLRGPGLRKATGIGPTGKVIWRNVRLARGTAYTYVCDPHSDEMAGRFKVV